MFDLLQLRDYIIQAPTKVVNLWSPSSDVLLLGTCGIETNYGQYVHQINGSALGIYQMEPATHDDIWENYLQSRQVGGMILQKSRVMDFIGFGKWDIDPHFCPPSQLLIYNLYYATLMARVFYLRIPEPLPAANDAVGMATYYKKYYNTDKGAAEIGNCIQVFKDLIVKLGG